MRIFFPLRRSHAALLIAGAALVVALMTLDMGSFANPSMWKLQWPKTDFSRRSIDLTPSKRR